MQTKQEFSSKQILDSIPRFEDKKFDADVMNNFYNEVEKEMKEFDIQKNQRISRSNEDLNKLVITA